MNPYRPGFRIDVRCEVASRRLRGGMGIVYADLGDVRRAIGFYEQALAIARAIGDMSGEAKNSFNMAILYRQQGDTARALELAQHALRLFRQMESPNAQNAAQLYCQRAHFFIL